MTAPDPYGWRSRFLFVGKIEGRWVFWRWIEAKTNYFHPSLEERRLPR